MLKLNMFNPNLEKLFVCKHTTFIVTYDLDCHQNLYDNLLCSLSDEDADFFEVHLNVSKPEKDQAPCDISAEIANALADEFANELRPAYVLIDLESVAQYYNQPNHYPEFCAQLLKINALAQKENIGIVLAININDPWATATTTVNYIQTADPKQNGDFTIFAMTDKNTSLLTYANGTQAKQLLDLDAF